MPRDNDLFRDPIYRRELDILAAGGQLVRTVHGYRVSTVRLPIEFEGKRYETMVFSPRGDEISMSRASSAATAWAIHTASWLVILRDLGPE